jgi:hypothetical protein
MNCQRRSPNRRPALSHGRSLRVEHLEDRRLLSGMPGDFNDNAIVDAADFTVWQDLRGSNTALVNDGGLGVPIGSAHYELWKTNFGRVPVTEPDPIEAGDYTVQVPSSAGGEIGIAVRVFHPATDEARYSDGAPIIVDVQGGWSAGRVSASGSSTDESAHGFVRIEFMLPGGSFGDVTSGGEYDIRGPDSVQALADVLSYASGELADMSGALITDQIPFALTDQVGILGGSNGGNLALATLAEHGATLSSVRWFVAWESPIGDQYAAIELNDNPFYTPGTCTATTCPTPGLADALFWMPLATTSPVNFDTGNWSFPGAIGAKSADGTLLKVFDKFPAAVTGNATGVQLYPTVEFGEAIRDAAMTLFPPLGNPPPWLVTDEAEIAAYWNYRDGAIRIPEVHALLPELLVIHVGTVIDHVQTQPDYPHAASHIQAWLDVGHDFVRVNADAEYLSAISGLAAGQFPDNEANQPIPYPGSEDLMLAEKYDGIPVGAFANLAAMLELADRAHEGVTDTNLDAVIPLD